MSDLALLGGQPIRLQPFQKTSGIGIEERDAVLRVLERGILSQFLGEPGEDFLGGPEIRAVESEFAAAFGVREVVSTNSATTGLQTAVAACGIEPGDEVIVSPFTMSATATAILSQNAIPVFADINPDTFCLDPESVRARLSPKTRAIMAVDIFGQPAHWQELRTISREHGLKLIEDAAQAAGSEYRGERAGTLGHIGVLSLNYHKIIHSGEGGMLLFHDPGLAERARFIRNHGEVVVADYGVEDIAGLVGSNFRMTELEASISREQLKKLPGRFAHRYRLGRHLTSALEGRPGIRPPRLTSDITTTFYTFAVRLDGEALGVSRSAFVKALSAEGVPFGEGYVKPIYLQPLYQQKIAFGRRGCPWTCGHYGGDVSYEAGICPVAEKMHDQELILGDFGSEAQTEADMDDVVRAFDKVLEHLPQLAAWEARGTA